MKRKETRNVHYVTHGNVTLPIYEVNRGKRTVFSVAHKENGRRQLKQFGDLLTATAWGDNRAKEIDRGEVPKVMLPPDEGAVYRRAMEILRGIGKPLDLVAREYVDAMHTLGGAARLDDAATFYAERRLRLEQRTVPEVVAELLAARSHRSERHVSDLKHRLNRFAGDLSPTNNSRAASRSLRSRSSSMFINYVHAIGSDFRRISALPQNVID